MRTVVIEVSINVAKFFIGSNNYNDTDDDFNKYKNMKYSIAFVIQITTYSIYFTVYDTVFFVQCKAEKRPGIRPSSQRPKGRKKSK